MLKATGIVRKVDNMGRIALPAELRRTLGMPEGTPLEILVGGDTIVFKKPVEKCIFCGSEEYVVDFKDKKVCTSCASDFIVAV